MWKSFYENSEFLELPLLSMFMFALSFAGAVFFGLRMKRDDPISSLPLQDDSAARPGAILSEAHQ
jgi:hypothetical protein